MTHQRSEREQKEIDRPSRLHVAFVFACRQVEASTHQGYGVRDILIRNIRLDDNLDPFEAECYSCCGMYTGLKTSLNEFSLRRANCVTEKAEEGDGGCFHYLTFYLLISAIC